MKIITLLVFSVLIMACDNSNLYAQCVIKITGNTFSKTVLTANSTGGALVGLDWEKDGKTVASLGLPRLGVTVAGGNGEGNAADQLAHPNGVFVDKKGNLWVADTHNGRIQKFVPGCTKGVTVGAELPNAPSFPINLFVCDDGSVYVADYFESRVKRLAANGTKWIDVAGKNNEMKLTRGVWVDKQGNVFSTDCGNSRVLKYAPHSYVGVVVAGGNGYGSALNQLARPASVVADDAGNLYIADQDNDRVVKWAPGAKSGVLVAGFTGTEVVAGNKLNNPKHASVGDIEGINATQRAIYISDNFARVQLWIEGSSSGTVIAGGNGRGDKACQLDNPNANFVCGDYLYVADTKNHRIQRFDLRTDMINTQFTVSEPGNYRAVATFENGCTAVSNSIQITASSVEPAIFSKNTSNSAAADGTLKKASAYPNPAKNVVTINFYAKQNEKYVLELRDLSGKNLFTKEVKALAGINKTTIDVSRFAKGIYFINIIAADKTRQNIKLNIE